MLLTYNVKHYMDLSDELEKGRKVAETAIRSSKLLSTKDVKYIGLKATISNQIIRKYSVKNSRIKGIHNIVLPVPGRDVTVKDDLIYVPCLKCTLPFDSRGHDIVRVNYVEFDRHYAHIACTVPEQEQYVPERTLGVDRNTTGHVAVAACPETGKVYKFGKSCSHIRKKYSSLRRTAQKQGSKKTRHKFRKAKIYKQRERNIIKNENHHISKAIVANAKEQKASIVLEDLKSIRNTAKTYGRSQRRSLYSWSFYQLQQFIEYKAKLQGVPVVFVQPEYTSQLCSKCGAFGERNGKLFKCPHCGHADHADVNAGFNIALRGRDGRLGIDRDVPKGYTDKPEGGTIYIEELLFGNAY